MAHNYQLTTQFNRKRDAEAWAASVLHCSHRIQAHVRGDGANRTRRYSVLVEHRELTAHELREKGWNINDL